MKLDYRALLGAFLLLGTAGCTAMIDGTATSAGGEQQQQQEQPKVAPGPPDRDLDAVTAALRHLDACKLFDTSGSDVGTVATGPHSCLLYPGSEYSVGAENIRLQVGVDSDHIARFSGKAVTVGGFKAYTHHDGDGGEQCRVILPVSHTRAIQLSYRSTSDGDACPDVLSYAEDTAKRLSNPDALAIDAGKHPFSAWDGCSLLTQVLGADGAQFQYKPNGVYDQLSGCRAVPKDIAKHDDSVRLEVHYEKWEPKYAGKPTQVAGKPAGVNSSARACSVEWSQGASAAGNEWFGSVVFTVSTKDCDQAKAVAEQTAKLAGTAPEQADVKPQRPLLYKPAENDTGTVGACGHFPQGATGDCEPFHEDTTFPQGVDDLLAASDLNRHIQCAVFKDAIAQVYGPEFKPVTWGAHCFFVEPTTALQIRVNVDGGNAPAPYGDRGDLYTDRKITQIAGKAAVTFFDSRKTAYDVYVSPYNDINRLGNVHINVEAHPPRGVGGIDPEVDLEKLTAADEVITKVIQQYFA